MTKKITKKTVLLILLFSFVGILLIGSIATGIYFGVTTIPCEGYVLEEGTNAPLANVSVTDGRNVVKTDSLGKFKLKGWHKAKFVVVTNPTGYWTENYYISINKDIKSYEFKLTKQQKDMTDHTFVHLTDTEIGANGVGEKWMGKVKEIVATEEPAFIVQTGDICYEPGLRKHKEDMNSENMGVPVRYTLGNHDYVEYGKYGEQLFEEIYGPVWYSFDVGNIHYVVTPIGHGDSKNRYSLKETWAWLANDLANVEDGKKVVIFNHDTCPDENGFVVNTGTKKLDLKKEGLIAWVYGHWHVNMVNNINGILNISTTSPAGGGIDSSPSAIRTIDVNGNAIVSSKLHNLYFEKGESQKDFIWQTELGGRGYFGKPILSDGKVYVSTIDDNYPAKPKISCVDALSGNIIWSFDTTNNVVNDMQLKDGNLYAQDSEGFVYSINASSGTQNWKVDLQLKRLRDTRAALIIEDNRLYCGNGKMVYCLDANNGNKIWFKNLKNGENSPIRFSIEGNALVVGAHWNTMFALNKKTGKKIWTADKKNIYTVVTPYFYDNKMLSAEGSRIYELNMKNGKVVREKSFDGYSFNVASKPYVENGIAYFATTSKGIVAINLSNLEIVWNFETSFNLISTSPYSSGNIKTVEASILSKNDKLYFGGLDGVVYCVDKQGNLIQKFETGSPILSAVALDGEFVYAIDFSGRLTKIKM